MDRVNVIHSHWLSSSLWKRFTRGAPKRGKEATSVSRRFYFNLVTPEPPIRGAPKRGEEVTSVDRRLDLTLVATPEPSIR